MGLGAAWRAGVRPVAGRTHVGDRRPPVARRSAGDEPRGRRAGRRPDHRSVDARRLRVNGVASGVGPPLRVTVAECFANCPKYIQQRALAPAPAAGAAGEMRRTAALSPAQRTRIARADTFFVASQHAARRARRVASRRQSGLRRGGRRAPPRLAGLQRQHDVPDPRQPDQRPARRTAVRRLHDRRRTAADRPRRHRFRAPARPPLRRRRAGRRLRAIDEVRETPALVPLRAGDTAYSPYNP